MVVQPGWSVWRVNDVLVAWLGVYGHPCGAAIAEGGDGSWVGQGRGGGDAVGRVVARRWRCPG